MVETPAPPGFVGSHWKGNASEYLPVCLLPSQSNELLVPWQLPNAKG
jgi:hypothetical protein